MKKTTLMHVKNGDKLVPAYENQFEALNKTIKPGAWVKVTYENPKKPKSNNQLGFLYAQAKEDGRSGIYEFIVSLFLDRDGHLYQVEKFGCVVTTKANITNVDILMKELFRIHKGIKEFNKRDASMELMAEYINFLDMFCIENFGYPIPDAIKSNEDKQQRSNHGITKQSILNGKPHKGC